MGDVRCSNGGSAIVPQHVVTDFAYPIIYAVLSVFNRMNVTEYLQFVHGIINGIVSSSTLSFHCFVSICCSHMIKAVCGNLHKREQDYAKIKFALIIFPALQCCHYIHTAKALYRSSYIVFCSSHASQLVNDSYQYLDSIVIHRKLESE